MSFELWIIVIFFFVCFISNLYFEIHFSQFIRKATGMKLDIARATFIKTPWYLYLFCYWKATATTQLFFLRMFCVILLITIQALGFYLVEFCKMKMRRIVFEKFKNRLQ